MTKVAYLQCPTGLAGDMCLGALVDAGVPLDYLVAQLNRLGISQEYKLWAERSQRNGQAATKVHVDLLAPAPSIAANSGAIADVHTSDPHPTFVRSASTTEAAVSQQSKPHTHTGEPHAAHAHGHPHTHPHEQDENTATLVQNSSEATHTHEGRNLPEIEAMIRAAHLPPRAEAWSLAVFGQLAVAEGAVHGIAPEQVHFHEVGAIDAIVDIVGTCLGLDWLGIEQLYCSPLPTGGGIIRAAHGLLPVPAPAVLKLWEMRQVPIYSNGIQRELVTPTGAAIATTLATQFGPPPTMTLHKVGLGAGSRDLPIPNILRLWIGEAEETGQPANVRMLTSNPSADATNSAIPLTQNPQLPAPEPQTSTETVAVLETQIDDLTPQAIAYTTEMLFAAGALDVFTQPVMMKKSRLGTLITTICFDEQIADCEEILFRETTTLGIRRSIQQRSVLQRDIETVQTPYGAVRIKVARKSIEEAPLKAHPEYEDCAEAARRNNISWQAVHQAALEAWGRSLQN